MPYQGAMFQQGAGPYNAQQGWTQYPFPQGYGGAAAGPQVSSISTCAPTYSVHLYACNIHNVSF